MGNDIFMKEIEAQSLKNQAATEFINIVSRLWHKDAIELVFFRQQVINKGISKIFNLMDYARKFVEKPINIYEVLETARIIESLNLPSSKLDIGKLTYERLVQKNTDARDFIKEKLKDIASSPEVEARDVVLYGFGRIGRLVARELTSRIGKGTQLRLRAIVVRGELTPQNLEKRASLLRNDSVHGEFPGTVDIDVENKALIINGMTVFLINANAPSEIDYTQYGIKNAIVIDNTGVWRDTKGLSLHLDAKGTKNVILTAPGKDAIPNIVYGVNHNDFTPETNDIFSAASCTTNAITPVLKVIEDTYGVDYGHIETIHAYTNDQNLVDNYHKKYRRGRSAATNIVITETGAGKAVAKAIPSLKGKLTSNAIRVPVPNGSLAILNLTLNKTTSLEDLKQSIKEACLDGDLVEQIKYAVSNELVSSDIVGISSPAIFDSNATIVSEDGKNVLLYVWYDNEFGYVHQVIRLAKHVGKVRRYFYY